jgi:hypothetical protein
MVDKSPAIQAQAAVDARIARMTALDREAATTLRDMDVDRHLAVLEEMRVLEEEIRREAVERKMGQKP